jgi:predicted thioredoxin/glutaredoxin
MLAIIGRWSLLLDYPMLYGEYSEGVLMYFTSGETRGIYWINIYDGEQHVTIQYAEMEIGAWVMCKTALKVAMEER